MNSLAQNNSQHTDSSPNTYAKKPSDDIFNSLYEAEVPFPISEKLKVIENTIYSHKDVFAHYKYFPEISYPVFEFYNKVYSQPKLVYVKCYDKGCEVMTVKLKLSLYKQEHLCVCIAFNKKRPNDPYHLLVSYITKLMSGEVGANFNSLLKEAGAKLRMQKDELSSQELCYLIFSNAAKAKQVIERIEDTFDPGIYRPIIFYDY